MKQKISANDAREMLLNLSSKIVMDKLYGAVNDCFLYRATNIHKLYSVVNEDGTTFTEDEEEQWFDTVREDFFDKFYEATSEELYSIYGIKPKSL